MDKDQKLHILIAIFISALAVANLLGGKITSFLGISFSVGIFAYPITFLITDIVEEVYGKKVVKGLITAGMISLIFIIILTLISVLLPAASRYPHNEAYVTIFSASVRMIVASLVAFTISQTHDVWAFEFLKRQTKGKFLWLRNNVSTIISQLIDTTIFMFIAFYMAAPKFTAPFIISLIMPYWLLKIVAATLDTPFVYLGVKWARK